MAVLGEHGTDALVMMATTPNDVQPPHITHPGSLADEQRNRPPPNPSGHGAWNRPLSQPRDRRWSRSRTDCAIAGMHPPILPLASIHRWPDEVTVVASTKKAS